MAKPFAPAETLPPKRGGGRRHIVWPLAFGIVAVFLLSGGVSLIGATQPEVPALAAPGSASDAASQLAAASASLAAGHGPARGQPLLCSARPSGAQASCSAATPAVGNVGAQKWESGSNPQARAGAAMTYDAKDRYVLLFGGFNGSVYLGDTWEFIHGMWVQLSPLESPSARANASIAYDAKDLYVVLFGGYDGTHVLGDTWKFVGGTWTPLAPSTSPPARKDATMTYDARDGYLVLFGGSSGSAALADTWTFMKAAWTAVSPSSPPGARWGGTSTFDSADNYVLLFGGYSGSSFLGDTWEYASGQWSRLSPATSPSPRFEAVLSYDTNNSYAVLFGGAIHSGARWTALGDTWSYVGGAWALRTTSAAPEARQAAGVAYSGTDNDVLVFGGVVDGSPIAATDSWEYHTGNWYQILSQPETTWAVPAGRVGAATAYEPNIFDAVSFGGSTGYGPTAQTWLFYAGPGATSLTWHEIFPATAPSARAFAGMAFDAKDGYIVLFGGMSPTGAALGDTWEFNSGVWNQLHPPTSPAARYGAMMTYDAADGYVLLFGGTSGATYFSDTWTYQGGSWSQLHPTSSPMARAFGGLAFDNTSGSIALFGGTSGSSALGDTWKFSGGTWTSLNPVGNPTLPPPEWGMAFVDNGKSNNVFMFGGCTAASVNPLAPACPASDMQNTTWYYRVSWTVNATVNPLTGRPPQPPPGFFPNAVFLAAPKEFINLYYGGITARGQLVTNRWVFQSGIWNNWYALPSPTARYGEVYTFDSRSERNLMFGGIGPVPGGGLAYLSDTWEWDTGLWAQANATPIHPSARAFSAAIYFGTLTYVSGPKALNRTVLFGGVGPTGYLGDTWDWVGSPIGGHWMQLRPAASPSARANASIAYDAADNEIVLFGGQASGGYLGDTWAFTLSGTWTQLSPATSPSARAGAAMSYDHQDGYVVLFGGRNAGGALGDTWEFVHGQWTPLAPATSPSPRYGSGIVDCPLISNAAKSQPEVVLLSGGTNGGTFFGDTWAFVGGQWTLLNTSTPDLVPFAFGALGNDIDDGHPSVFGGLAVGGPLDEFWEFKLGP